MHPLMSCDMTSFADSVSALRWFPWFPGQALAVYHLTGMEPTGESKNFLNTCERTVFVGNAADDELLKRRAR